MLKSTNTEKWNLFDYLNGKAQQLETKLSKDTSDLSSFRKGSINKYLQLNNKNINLGGKFTNQSYSNGRGGDKNCDLNIDLFNKIRDFSIVVENGRVDKKRSVIPKNITLSNFDEIDENTLLKYLKKTKSDDDLLINLNNGLCTSGFLVNVDKTHRTQVVHVQHNTCDSGLQQWRHIYNIKSGADVTFIETFDSNCESFNNSISQWDIGKSANVTKYSFGSRAGGGSESQSNYTEMVEQAENSRCDFYSFFYSKARLGFSGYSKNNINIQLNGENINSNLWSISALNESTQADNKISLKHLKAKCSSKQVFKGLYDEYSGGEFDSCVYVAQDAQKSDTVQENNNILLSDNAKIVSNPQLEIFADDVACAHGSTTGQIDKNAMFYMNSRGIGEGVARGLLLFAFINKVINMISNPKIKEVVVEELNSQLLIK